MSEITYRVGDATAPQEQGHKIVAHVCNDFGRWGKGFVLAVSARWKEPERCYREWSKGQGVGYASFDLGNTQFIRVEPEITVANMIGQHGTSPHAGKPPVRYEAIRKALGQVAVHALNWDACVCLPRIGCGLAGGEWANVEPILQEELCRRGVRVVVYDLPAARR